MRAATKGSHPAPLLLASAATWERGQGSEGGEDLVHVKSHSSSTKFILWLASVCLEWGCNLTAVYKGSVRGLLGANSQLLSS